MPADLAAAGDEGALRRPGAPETGFCRCQVKENRTGRPDALACALVKVWAPSAPDALELVIGAVIVCRVVPGQAMKEAGMSRRAQLLPHFDADSRACPE